MSLEMLRKTRTIENRLEQLATLESASLLAIDPIPNIAAGRLTLTTGVPVTSSDVTAATTLYFSPYNGNQIALYDGSSAWSIYEFSELSISLSGKTADTNYDVFLYDNSGTLTLELVAWSSSGAGSSTRATAITLQNGVYVKSGSTTKRYLGTIRITSTTGQCEDSETKRFVWNMNNQIARREYKADATFHTYAVNAVRYCNNDSTNKVEFVVGISGAAMNFGFSASFASSSAGTLVYAGVGVDAIALTFFTGHSRTAPETKIVTQDLSIAAGYHYIAMVEYPVAVTISVYGMTLSTLAVL